jgi:hypothetical protein
MKMQVRVGRIKGYAITGIAALAAGFGMTRSASAALLLPGGDVIFTGADAEALPAGLIIQNQTDPFTGINGLSTVFTGTIQSLVIVDGISGNDDFVYQVKSTAGPDSIDRLAIQSFTGFATDVGFVPGNTDPFFADRTADGSVVGFNFVGNEIAPGGSSDLLVVKTDSKAWVEGDGTLIDGGSGSAQVTVPTFSLNNGVPEPTTAALISLGSGFLMVRRRRS